MGKNPDASRIFFALLPDAGTVSDIEFHAAQLSLLSGKKVPPENYHITLLFLGNVDAKTVDALCMDCGNVAGRAFSLTINHAGWWKKAGILWLAPDTTPPALSDLVGQLGNIAGQRRLGRDTRPYLPHITVMRKVFEAPQQPLVRPFQWQAFSFSLMQSITHPDGVEYRELERWALAP